MTASRALSLRGESARFLQLALLIHFDIKSQKFLGFMPERPVF